ncbi:MAG: hypothetical protein IJU93_08840 [Lachnospiraceae bacterium]|nr:hypothetical protein [Lachnospiraceae bacterium]
MEENGELLLKKRQEYVQQQRDNIQQTENFYLQYAQMDQLLNKEAEETITPENLQERIEAEKQAGLAEKKIPEQPLTSGEIEKIQDEYAAIHADAAMSNKELKKAKKEYARKIKRVEKANKIFNNFRAYESSMKKMLTGQIMGMGHYYHEDLFGHVITEEETNVKAAIWLNTFTGGSVIDMLDTADNLLISNDEATKEQAERKALEIEKMMDIFLNYDISKLKYKNSDDFLKNASERMMIGQFASQMDKQFENYRDLIDRGLLKKPLNPHLINEAQARAKLIQASMERTLNKLMLLSSEKYALRDRDSVGEYSDTELELFAGMTAEQADRIVHGAYFYSRESANEDIEKYKYFSAAYNLRMLDKKGRSERFRRGDNPESFLDAYRKKVNEEHPVSGT